MNTVLAIVLAIVISFLIAFLLGFVLIPWLRKLHFGQTILEIGPAWHKSKQGTPVMGGFMFIISTVVAFAAVALTDYLRVIQEEYEGRTRARSEDNLRLLAEQKRSTKQYGG